MTLNVATFNLQHLYTDRFRHIGVGDCLKTDTYFNPARALTSGKTVSGVFSVSGSTFSLRETPQAFFSNPDSMRKRVIDTYSPSLSSDDTPLTLYKFNRATKTIKKINIIDG